MNEVSLTIASLGPNLNRGANVVVFGEKGEVGMVANAHRHHVTHVHPQESIENGRSVKTKNKFAGGEKWIALLLDSEGGDRGERGRVVIGPFQAEHLVPATR